MKTSILEQILHNNLNAHLRGVSRSWTDNILGYSGIGKTYLVKYLATLNDCILISVPVSELEPADLVGTPHPVEIRPRVFVQMYALPNWLVHIRVDGNGEEMYKTFEDGIRRPLLDIDLLGAKVENRKELEQKLGSDWKDKVKGAVYFLDEINRAADDQMKNAIFEFVEKGRIHTYESPWNTYRISAMNPPNKNYFVNDMTEEKAFVGRFLHYILEMTTEEWLEWARKRGINELICSLIEADPKALMEDEDPITLPSRRMPRTHEMLSVAINETDFPTDPLIRKEYYQGAIGMEYGNILYEHEEKRFLKLPTPQEILLDYDSVRPLILEQKEERNDFINAISQYLISFLQNEKVAKQSFLKRPQEDWVDVPDVHEHVLTNFKNFVSDLYPHSRSYFIRRLTAHEHMSYLLIPLVDYLGELIEKESSEATKED